MRSWLTAVLTASLASTVFADETCGLLGPGYPAPRDLRSNSSLIAPAWANLTSQLDAIIAGKADVGLNVSTTTFSISAFSVHDPSAQQLFQYHYTSPSVANASKGVQSVNENSVYRLGSTSKLFTIYLMLIEAGSAYWDTPITEFIPELAAAANNSESDPLNKVQWQDVTIAALAGQMAGIARDSSNLIEELGLILPMAGVQPTSVGFPPANMSDPQEGPVCLSSPNNPCTREQFFSELLQRGPVYETWTTPVYSNIAYAILAIALEQKTGKNFNAMFQSSFVTPLGLTATSYTTPQNLSSAVLPNGDPLTTFFTADIGNETAAGGMYSSLADMSRIGISILNSTLIAPATTRRWLKPVTHTASLTSSVGSPWEIYRFTQPSTGAVTDLYTKEGDLGSYSTYLILSPDHDAGYAIMAAGENTALFVNALADMMTTTFAAALEAQAVAEAKINLAGTYKSTDGTSSITFSMPEAGSGLKIADWQSLGKPLLPLLASKFGATDIRVYPTDLRQSTECGGEKRAFRAVIQRNEFSELKGLFSGGILCRGWSGMDSFVYAKKALDEFVFELDAQGKAVGVVPSAVRTRLARSG